MIEGSGSGARSVPLTYGSVSRRPNNIRVRIHNTAFYDQCPPFCPEVLFWILQQRFCSESDGSLLQIKCVPVPYYIYPDRLSRFMSTRIVIRICILRYYFQTKNFKSTFSFFPVPVYYCVICHKNAHNALHIAHNLLPAFLYFVQFTPFHDNLQFNSVSWIRKKYIDQSLSGSPLAIVILLTSLFLPNRLHLSCFFLFFLFFLRKIW